MSTGEPSSEVERIQLLPQESGRGTWVPQVGETTQALLRRIRVASPETVRDEAVDVLSRCVSPTEPRGRGTGIVVGYVQSGKTMSFTAAAALARDNGYGLVIVITGISRNLFRQSTDRLRADLEIHGPSSRWLHVESPGPANTPGADRIRSAVSFFGDANAPSALRRTVLVTVMKHYTHLDNLISVLSSLDLDEVPVLVIDDEADQAGLNTMVSVGDESPTHSRLVSIRNALPHHTYLQYTATPQAPLLISLIDALSPNFAVVLTPGDDYTGGTEFFEADSPITRTIPAIDIPAIDDELGEPPRSLVDAMQVFVTGLAANLAATDVPESRSMLIHPSRLTAIHADCLRWARSILRRWQAELREDEAHPDRTQLVEEFARAYEDLADTVENIPSFDEVTAALPYAARATNVQMINSLDGPTPQPDWGDSQILVGGQALERGVTVEGLTVSYMPRGPGVGNADTIQQRARWFGYKADYLGYCRVYLPVEMIEAYRGYVDHEESMRSHLGEAQAAGESLAEWRRRFFLDPSLQPTRHNVIGLHYMRGDYANTWFRQEAPHHSMEAVEDNRALIEGFVDSAQFREERWTEAATSHQTHGLARGLRLADVYERLLVPLRIPNPSESLAFQGMLLQVGSYLEQEPEAECAVYLIRPEVGSRRTLTDSNEINQLFQGRSSAGADRYPGDAQFKSEEELSIQIHRVTALNREGQELFADLPAVAVWVPAVMSQPWLIERD